MDVAYEIAPEAVTAGVAAGTLRMCKSCERVHTARQGSATQAQPDAPEPAKVATNAFEQAAAGLHEAQPAGRYALQVCEDPRDVCERDACTLHSTRAAGTLDEVREASKMFRHAWAVDSAGARIALTEQPVPAAAENAPVEALPDGPMRVRLRMGFDPADMARLKAKADVDRATYLADSVARRAAERARYGAQPTPVEGKVVAHAGEAYGCLPEHAADSDVQAAISVLELCGHEGATLYGEDSEECHEATGFWVEPRGGGRVAIHHLVNGDRVTPDRGPWRAELNDYRAAFLTAGWTVEPMSVTCVFVHRPEGDGRPGIKLGATVRTPNDRVGTITELCVMGGVARATVDGGLTWRADSLEPFGAQDTAPGEELDFRHLAEGALAEAIQAGNLAEVESLIARFPVGDRVRQARTEIIKATAAQRDRIGKSRP